MSERRQLIDVAYRLLGSLVDAEDVVQEAYARWYAMSPEQQAEVDSPGAWLTTVVSRVCIDLLRSARHRRERYVGEWIPEPVPNRAEWMTGQPGAGVDPADRVTLDESISMAFLIVLESMTPAERVAFVLHDVFQYPFRDVSQIVGRSPAACRQLASSARRRLRPEQFRSWPSPSHSETVRRFMEAWQAQDLKSLVGLLDPHATVVADGGGLVSAALEPIEGASRVALAFVELLHKAPDLQIVERSVNGHPGLVVQRQGTTVAVMAVEVCGDHITRVWAVRNPEKLRHWVMTDPQRHLLGRPAADVTSSGRPVPRPRVP